MEVDRVVADLPVRHLLHVLGGEAGGEAVPGGQGDGEAGGAAVAREVGAQPGLARGQLQLRRHAQLQLVRSHGRGADQLRGVQL